jgi:hypothetical protein
MAWLDLPPTCGGVQKVKKWLMTFHKSYGVEKTLVVEKDGKPEYIVRW